MDEPTDRERARALAAIAAGHPDATIVARGPAECWAIDEGPERVIYLTDRPSELRAGEGYTTWMVALFRGDPVRVALFESTACSTRRR